MEYIISASSNVGISKDTNQDSVLVKKADTPIGKIVFAALCDGMGGLAKGEVASASVIRALSAWFDDRLPALLGSGLKDYDIRMQWEEIIRNQNQKINLYGRRNGVSMGTTAVILLLTPNRYYIMNVGDSRAYEISYGGLVQLTQDQSLVAKEVREGLLTPEEARIDERRNVLLQCVGASDAVYPEMFFGETKQDAVYMMCSDGFVHEITGEEMYQYLKPEQMFSKEAMHTNIEYLIQLNMQRNERDNISVIAIKAC